MAITGIGSAKTASDHIGQLVEAALVYRCDEEGRQGREVHRLVPLEVRYAWHDRTVNNVSAGYTSPYAPLPDSLRKERLGAYLAGEDIEPLRVFYDKAARRLRYEPSFLDRTPSSSQIAQIA